MSEIERIARAYIRALAANDQAAMAALVDAWRRVRNSIERDMLRVVALGQDATAEQLRAMAEYKVLSIRIDAMLAEYAQAAADIATDAQRTAAAVAEIDSGQMLRRTVPQDAAERVLGYAADGSPLADLIRMRYGQYSGDVIDTLFRGVALRQSPRETAKQMADVTKGALSRALTIARTETMRVARAVNLDMYARVGVIAYMRMATKSLRTCAACLARDGERVDDLDNFPAHPNCRCIPVPITPGVMPRWKTGAEWFDELGDDDKTAIIGRAGVELYNRGAKLDDWVAHTHDDRWGDAYVTRPARDVREKLGGRDANI